MPRTTRSIPRWDLVHQLIQYRKFKEAAAQLGGPGAAPAPEPARPARLLPARDGVERPLQPVGRIELWNTFNLVLRRLAEKLVVGEIHDEVVTVADQMEWLLGRLQTEPVFIFSSLFPPAPPCAGWSPPSWRSWS